VVCTQQGIPDKIFGSDSTAVYLQYAPQQAIMLPSSKRAAASQIFLLQQADQFRNMLPTPTMSVYVPILNFFNEPIH